MENDSSPNNQVEENQINLSSKAVAYLNESGKWGSFLAWLVIALLAIFFLVFVVASFFSAGQTQLFDQFEYKILIFIAYFIMAAIYFIPIYFLYNFSKNAKIAVSSKDSNYLENSMKNLKSLFKFYGIFSIIYLALMLFVGLGSLLAASFF
jgi:hypothetical protein